METKEIHEVIRRTIGMHDQERREKLISLMREERPDLEAQDEKEIKRLARSWHPVMLSKEAAGEASQVGAVFPKNGEGQQ